MTFFKIIVPVVVLLLAGNTAVKGTVVQQGRLEGQATFVNQQGLSIQMAFLQKNTCADCVISF